MKRLLKLSDLEKSVIELCGVEPRFQSILDLHGLPSLRASPQGLEGLLMIVTEQFLSLQAAAAIWARVRERIKPFDAETISNLSVEELLSLGLSRAKAKTFHETARRVLNDELDFTLLEKHDAENVALQLCALPGVGPWTADIYLLSVMGAADTWPVGDLALRIAVHDFLNLNDRPEIKDMSRHAEAWRPHRAVAARLLWSHYRGLKGLKQA
jgi:DNA-3-methyladenine glycosylase II